MLSLICLWLGWPASSLAQPLVFADRVIIDRVVVRRDPRTKVYPGPEKTYFDSLARPSARAVSDRLFVRRDTLEPMPHARAVIALSDRDFSSTSSRGGRASGNMFLGYTGRLHLEVGWWWQPKVASGEVPLHFFGSRDIESDRFRSSFLVTVDEKTKVDYERDPKLTVRLFERLTGANGECARRLGWPLSDAASE